MVEFFWNTDPGQGNGTSILTVNGSFDQAVEQMIASSISFPTQGTHVLSIRLKVIAVKQTFFA